MVLRCRSKLQVHLLKPGGAVGQQMGKLYAEAWYAKNPVRRETIGRGSIFQYSESYSDNVSFVSTLSILAWIMVV